MLGQSSRKALQVGVELQAPIRDHNDHDIALGCTSITAFASVGLV